MRSALKFRLKDLVNGLTISTLIYFPLINALNENYLKDLHWAEQDTIETTLSWIMMGALLGCGFSLINRRVNNQLNTFFYMLMIQVGGFFVIGALVRKSELINQLKSNPSIVYTITTIIALFLLAFTIWISTSSNVKFLKLPKNLLIFLAPLNLLMPLNLSIAHGNIHTKGAHTQPELNNISLSLEHGVEPLTVILLFDELSPDYLHGSRSVDLKNFPAINELLKNSNIFTNAFLPGGGTEKATRALFQNKFYETNLQYLITNYGFKASITGWYIDSCSTFFSKLDNCKSISFFNARTLDNNFSILNPLWTNLNLLPYQKPFGYLKIPAATKLHRQTLNIINHRVDAALENSHLNLIYAHINVPHTPLLDKKKYSVTDSRRFASSEDQYIDQLKYVDATIGGIQIQLEKISKSRQINFIIISDHNVRNLLPENQHEHVVLIYRRYPKLTLTQDVLNAQINVSDILIQIIKDQNLKYTK